MARRLRAQTRPGFGASQLGQPLIMWLLLAVLILLILGLAYGLYTRKGSGINKHPGPDSSDPIVGDETKAESKDLQDQRAGVDQTESAELDQHGTK